MGAQTEGTRLAAILDRRRQEIADAWVGRVLRMSDSRYRDLPPEELKTTSLSILEAVDALLTTGTSAGLESRLADITQTRLLMGFDIGEVLEMPLLMKEAALPFIAQAFPPGSPALSESVAQLDTCLRRIIRLHAHLYDQLMERRVEEQQGRTALMLHVAQTASSSLDLDRVLNRIVEGMKTAVGVRDCAIALLDAEQGRLIRQAGTVDFDTRLDPARNQFLIPASYPFFYKVMERREPVVCYDAQADPPANREAAQAQGLKSVLGVPMEVGDRLLGVAVISTFEEHHAFTPDEIELACGIAQSLALALENVHLYQETRQHLAESESLQRVTAALLHEPNLEQVLEIVCLEAQRLTGAPQSTVSLLESGENTWLQVDLRSGVASPTFERLPTVGPIVDRVTRVGGPVLTNEPAADLQEAFGDSPLTALLAVPLRLKASAPSVLGVANKPGGFTDQDLRILSLFADQAAIAIENARLHQRAEQMAVMDERNRMARELHDSVSQALYSMTNYAEAMTGLLAAGNIAQAREYLRELQDTAQDALQEMRLLIFELRPPTLEKEGLVAALRARLQAVGERAGLQTELRVTGERRLPFAEEVLYRIAQEVLNNVVKHARAKRVTVALEFHDDTARLEICDDGAGFDPAAARLKGRLGLRGMEERLKRIGGYLEIESAPGKGTRVRAVVGTRAARSEQVSLPGLLILPYGEANSQPGTLTGDSTRSEEAHIRVLVADDHDLVRKGIRAVLEAQKDIQVVGEASDGQEAVAGVAELRPDVILMDLAMPGIDGVEATRQIMAHHPEACILVLTSFAADEQVFRAIKAGALGYLLKESGPEDLVRAIHQVYRGESSLQPSIARKILQELVRLFDLPATSDRLSEREMEVLRLLAQGLRDREIAQQLVIAETTVRSHVSNVLSKLHLSSRTQAVLYALREGLVAPDAQRGPSDEAE